MSLNKNTKALLEALVTENDYLSYSVKRCITNCLNDDTKAANADFVTEMKKKLTEQSVRLPTNIEGKVICYSPENFIPERYYTQQNRIAIVLQSIIKMNTVAEIIASMRFH